MFFIPDYPASIIFTSIVQIVKYAVKMRHIEQVRKMDLDTSKIRTAMARAGITFECYILVGV